MGKKDDTYTYPKMYGVGYHYPDNKAERKYPGQYSYYRDFITEGKVIAFSRGEEDKTNLTNLVQKGALIYLKDTRWEKDPKTQNGRVYIAAVGVVISEPYQAFSFAPLKEENPLFPAVAVKVQWIAYAPPRTDKFLFKGDENAKDEKDKPIPIKEDGKNPINRDEVIFQEKNPEVQQKILSLMMQKER